MPTYSDNGYWWWSTYQWYDFHNFDIKLPGHVLYGLSRISMDVEAPASQSALVYSRIYKASLRIPDVLCANFGDYLEEL